MAPSAPPEATAWAAPTFLTPPIDSTNAEAESVHLPQIALRSIATYLVQSEAPGSVLINLLAMCGVCSEWRNVARELNPGTCLGFDGLDNAFPSQSSIQRFRRLTPTAKEEVFLAAARLFFGECRLPAAVLLFSHTTLGVNIHNLKPGSAAQGA